MLEQNKHRKYMYNIIMKIFDSKLKQNLALKWWTLCYFLHQLTRFSTDLDFDIINESDDIAKNVKNILEDMWNIKDMYQKQNTIFFLFDYEKLWHNIKLEISKRKYLNNTYENINFFGKDITAMAKDSIFANKLVACSQRFKNRDIFDIHFFFKEKYPVNKSLIKERTGKSYRDFLLELKNELPKHYSENSILAEMWDLIDNKQKIFVKKKLLLETLELINFAIFEEENPM